MKFHKTLAAAAFAACFAPLVWAQDGPLEAKIIATLNSEAISNYDLKSMMENGAASSDEAFNFLVDKSLIISLAKRYSISINELEIAAALAELLRDNSAIIGDFEKLSDSKKYFWHEQAKAKALQHKLFDFIVVNYANTRISDEKVREFYEQNLAARGAVFSVEEPKIRAFLQNQAAMQAIENFMEKERAKAELVIKDGK